MALKKGPVQLANGNFNGTQTWTLSLISPVEGMMTKRETTESCIILDVTTFVTGTVSFEADEFINGNWIPVGSTGSVGGTMTAVLDSSGGATSAWTAFSGSSSTSLRLLGKGTDTRVVMKTNALGTIGLTLDIVLYAGS